MIVETYPQTIPFEEWISQVDKIVHKLWGVRTNDGLPWPAHPVHEDGCDPNVGASLWKEWQE